MGTDEGFLIFVIVGWVYFFTFFFWAMIRLSPVGSNESTWPRSEPKHY